MILVEMNYTVVTEFLRVRGEKNICKNRWLSPYIQIVTLDPMYTVMLIVITVTV